MRIIYLGTPQFAVPSFHALLAAGHDVLAVITQPDKPAGRRGELSVPAMKQAAIAQGVPVLQPDRLRSARFLAYVRALAPELVAYAAYGRILPPDFLDIPPHGCLNVHASLLPRYRGAAPIHRAILNGDATTGVCIMRAEAGLDTGPVAASAETAILPDEDTGALTQRLAAMGAGLLVRVVADVAGGSARFSPQDPARATYAPPIGPEDARVRWSDSAASIHNRVRAMSPQPGAVASLRGRPVKLWRSALAEGDFAAAPGAVAAVEKAAVLAGTGQGLVRLLEVQPAGGKRMDAASFARGQRLAVGDAFADG